VSGTITNVIVRILPILLIIALGNLIRARKILNDSAVDQLRGLVVNIALPAVLFVAFLEMELQAAYVGLFATTIVVGLGMLGLGFLLRKVAGIKHDYFPYLIAGFEFGMVGITLFGSAYGLENVGYIAIVDLGHELFVWFVLATLLTAKRDGTSSVQSVLRGFATSPLIIAIFAALALNLLGVREWFIDMPVGAALMQSFNFLGNLLIPLILILIGYGMRLSWKGIQESLGVVVSRLAILLPLAIVVNIFVVRRWLGLGPGFEAALFTLFILPPPYIVPLFMPAERTEERVYVNNVLSVYTALSLAIFIIYFSINPAL
jgi:predicted permease